MGLKGRGFVRGGVSGATPIPDPILGRKFGILGGKKIKNFRVWGVVYGKEAGLNGGGAMPTLLHLKPNFGGKKIWS